MKTIKARPWHKCFRDGCKCMYEECRAELGYCAQHDPVSARPLEINLDEPMPMEQSAEPKLPSCNPWDFSGMIRTPVQRMEHIRKLFEQPTMGSKK